MDLRTWSRFYIICEIDDTVNPIHCSKSHKYKTIIIFLMLFRECLTDNFYSINNRNEQLLIIISTDFWQHSHLKHLMIQNFEFQMASGMCNGWSEWWMADGQNHLYLRTSLNSSHKIFFCFRWTNETIKTQSQKNSFHWMELNVKCKPTNEIKI